MWVLLRNYMSGRSWVSPMRRLIVAIAGVFGHRETEGKFYGLFLDRILWVWFDFVQRTVYCRCGFYWETTYLEECGCYLCKDWLWPLLGCLGAEKLGCDFFFPEDSLGLIWICGLGVNPSKPTHLAFNRDLQTKVWCYKQLGEIEPHLHNLHDIEQI